ncbi:MAG TPA: MBL fold metallo-hydrolase [Candidatus Saccharimonadales bacterium]|nr:MBL fold metallo-hydrolase [Candidatus Saccharimonadales bacterium]
MNVTLHGAAGEVTGSAYHVQTSRASVLVDFGLFQGRHMADQANHVPHKLDVNKLNAVVLTHAHLDHTGRLPLLTKAGYRGPIYATKPSLETTQLILQDAAKLQEQDAARTNRKRADTDKPAVEPLFTSPDVEAVMALFKPLPYSDPFPVAPGITVRMFEAGHILGSTSIEMTVEDSGVKRVVVFSGDLGPRNSPILKDSACLTRADLVFMESTYGDRDHRSLTDTLQEFRQLISEAVAQKGKILVPTFAVGRAQLLQYHLANMFLEKIVPPFPVILDSPMAIKATELYSHYPELFDEDMTRLAGDQVFLKHIASIRRSITADESRALNELPGPCLIMAGAGMCNAGRIMHHLRHNLPFPETVVLIVGYQAPGSLGRLLAEGATEVHMFGETIPVRAKTHSLGGFSAHAGQTDLLEWFNCLAPKHPRVVLTHGEDRGRLPLAELIEKRFGIKPILPLLGDVVEI